MTNPVATAFKTGNSVAVRIPKTFGVVAGDQFELVHGDHKIELRQLADPRVERAKVLDLIRALEEIGPVIGGDPDDGRIEFPDRPGLY